MQTLFVRRYAGRLVLGWALLLIVSSSEAGEAAVSLKVDATEAEAVLTILDLRAAGRALGAEEWRRLHESEPFRRLERRELAMKQPFSRKEFGEYVLGPQLLRDRRRLACTLDQWTRADLAAVGQRVLEYLPQSAKIHATVFPLLKPRPNSFVYDLETSPAIYLHLDPAMSPEQFENTVAHELHHIGFSSVEADDGAESQYSEAQLSALRWMSAFGEGIAMLAAAGSPDVHPHLYSPTADRERWNRDVARFDEDSAALERFILDVLDGRLSDAQITETGMSFFGTQGPWYTVGWKMAVTIEKRFGRAVLISCMRDPRRLLAKFNEAARDSTTEQIRLWSPDLIRRLDAH